VVLAVLSTIGGALQLPFAKSLHHLESWLHPVVEFGEADIHSTWAYKNKYVLLAVAVVVALAGIAAAVAVYVKKRRPPIEPVVLEQGWYYDKAVTDFMGGPGRKAFARIAWFDSTVVDGAVNGVAKLVRGSSSGLRRTQSGLVRQYAALLGVGVVLLMVWFVVIRGII
jgi:NADH-quinone oxidoreductase subunit L